MSDPLPGRELEASEHPRLRALIDALAKRVEVEPPTSVRLTPDLNAFAAELGRLFRTPQRVVVVGVATFSLLDERQLAAVLAHELAHLRLGDAGLAPSRQLARLVFGAARTALAGGLTDSLAQAAIRGLLATEASARAGELAADGVAARVVERAWLKEALIRSSLGAPLFERFIQREVAPLVELGRYPENLYDGLRRYLSEAGRDPFTGAVARSLRAVETNVLDTHPALVARVAHLEHLAAEAKDDPEGALGVTTASARALLDDPDQEEARTTRAWAESLPLPQAPRVIAWADVGQDVLKPWLATRAAQLCEQAQSTVAPSAQSTRDVVLELVLLLEDEAPAEVARRLDPALVGLADGAATELLGVALGQLLTAVLLDQGWALEHAVGRPLVVTRGTDRLEPLPLCAEAFEDPRARARLLAAL